MAKNIDSRIMHKHDTEENWKKAINFIPKSGELIIYDTDENHPFPRTKIGNGISKINELPFSSFSIENYRKTVSQENSMLRLSDISSDSHKVDIKLRSKNLIPYPYKHTTKTTNGVTFTDNGDGSITISGTATANTQFILLTDGKLFTSYTDVKVNASTVKDDKCLSLIVEGDAENLLMGWERVGYLYLLTSTGATYNCTVYPQLEKGTIATEYTPYVPEDAEVTLTTCGKNLIHFPYKYLPETEEHGGLTYTPLEEGGVNVNGTCTAMTTVDIDSWRYWDEGFIASGLAAFSDVSNKVWLRHWQGNVVDNKIYYPQIEIGTTATEYEPYKQGETITTTLADGAALASIYPNMSIISNVQGVVIEATYNSMHFDEKWNGLINSAVDSISNSDIDRLF